MRTFLIIALLAGSNFGPTIGNLNSPGVALQPAPGTSPSWGLTGSLNTSGGSATLLQNGKVLVVGDSAEFYNPATGQWSYTSSPITPRGGHIAVRLLDGRVLVAGGNSPNGDVLTSAEIYDPATGLWSPAGDLSVPRAHHTANLLNDGTVIVIGGQVVLEVLADRVRYLTYSSAEIYDPATGQWNSAGTMPSPHAHHASIVLANGNVLVIGGDNDHLNQRSSSLFDPVTRNWTATGDTISARWQPRATILPDGKVLVAGGDGGMDEAEIYDPVTGKWSATGRMTTRRREHSLTLLPDGTVLAAGGHKDDEDYYTGEGTVWNSAEIYDPVTGQWSPTTSMNVARYGHTATRLDNGKVLVVGGCTNGVCLNTAELYDSGSNPIDYAQFFIRQHYLDFLAREPEPSGLLAWLNVLNNCSTGDLECQHRARLTTSAAFFGSTEFQLKGYFVFRFYKLSFNRLPEYSEFVADMQSVTGQTPADVYARKAMFSTAFVQRPEFSTNFSAMSQLDYVAALLSRYDLSTITTADPSQPDGSVKVTLPQAELVRRLDTGELTRAQVLRAVADSDEVCGAEFNPAFVAMQYYGYLRRKPEPAGYSAWLTYLNAHPTDFITMVRGFVDSIEYRMRFGQP